MYELTIRSEKKKKTVRVVKWLSAVKLIDKAMTKGLKIEVTEKYFDCYISTIDGELYLAAERISAKDAAYVSFRWAKKDDRSGCMIWPHGRELPEGWSVTEDNEETNFDTSLGK